MEQDESMKKAATLTLSFNSMAAGHCLRNMYLDNTVSLAVNAIATEDYISIFSKSPGIKTYYTCFAHAVALGAFLQSQGLIDFDKIDKSVH